MTQNRQPFPYLDFLILIIMDDDNQETGFVTEEVNQIIKVIKIIIIN
jgi:hypothetical protein